MKPIFFTLITAGMFISFSSFGQEVKPQIEKVINDPAAKENSAKADVYFHKKAMVDSASFIDKPKQINSSKPKGKHCFKKKSKSA
jgi:hypothetical protein